MTVTVLSGPERRRRWTTAEKLRIVQESVAPDAIVNEIARRYDIHPHQLHAWRQQTRRGVLAAAVGPGTAGESGSQFVPVAVATGGVRRSTPKAVAVASLPIELVLRNGRVLRLAQSVPPACVAALADALEGFAR
jgi:transposase-like protein